MYQVAPQGSLSSMGGFNYWYDGVIRHLKRKKKCTDDVAGWAPTPEQLFWDTCEFLTVTCDHRIIQNKKKFVWSREELEYDDLYIMKDGVRPSDDTLQAIREFPWPADLTGIRSWYGLVEQVSFAFTKAALMEPFRELMSKNSEYVWSPLLQAAFDRVKSEIVELVRKGVKSFQLGAWTCLVTDWSQKGIGYVLWQKRCRCERIHPTFCATGWVMVVCGLRFCTSVETRYHPIEGELLDVAWGLEKTKMFTLGCDRLLVLVENKPLIGLLTNRELGEIENPWLMHLTERLLRWHFRIEHIAGARNYGPDALSRSPGGKELAVGELKVVNTESQDWSDDVEGQVLAIAASRQVLVVSWDMVRSAGLADKDYSSLLYVLGQDGGSWD